MESLTRSLNYELPHDLQPYELHNQYAHQILENGKAIAAAADVSTPTITTLDLSSANSPANSASSEFLQKLGASLLNSIQLQRSHPIATASSEIYASPSMDLELAPNHVVIDSSSFDGMDELQKQIEYDKFMNEVWIGVVLTLILISMVFCICSCFLYHQFRTWKRNYHSTVAQGNAQDIEALKLHPDIEDPVPEYTLVSGLPSYEAALELMQKTRPQGTCMLVYPSVFGVFNRNEKLDSQSLYPQQPQQQLHSTDQQIAEVNTPLLDRQPTATPIKCLARVPSYAEATNTNVLQVTMAPEKSPKRPLGTVPAPNTSNSDVTLKKSASYDDSSAASKPDKC